MVVLHPSSLPLAEPYPHDGLLGGFGIRLGASDRNGTILIGQVPPDQGAVAPARFGEQARNPEFGGVISHRDLSGGMGQRRLREDGNGRVWYTLGARTRPGYALKGPALTTYTPGTLDSTVGITRWFEIGGRLYALNGRYAQNCGTDGVYVGVSQDFGVGKAATDVIVLQDNHSSATRYALVAMGDSENVWTFTGATGTTVWAQTSGGDAFKARAFTADTLNLFYVNDSNVLNSCDLDANVLTVANHASATDTIGTKDCAVTRLHTNGDGGLLANKTDDIYSLQPDGSWKQLFSERQFVLSSANGEALSRWGNDSYVTYGFTTYRLTDDGGLTPIGPEQIRDNGSEVRGYLTAHCGTDFFLLAGLYNPDSGASYVMEFDGHIGQDARGLPYPIWHGSISAAFTGKKITSIHQSSIGAPTGHKRAYIGFSDGTYATYILACSADPKDCTSEVFQTADGYVYYSRMQFYFPGQRKAILAATGEADNFSSSDYAALAYRSSESGSYTDLGTNFDSGERKRVTFPDAFSCTWLDTRVTLVSASSASSPRLTGFSFDWLLRVPPQEIMLVNVLAEDGLRQRDGTPYRVGAKDIRDRINSLAGLAGGITFVDPNGDSHQVTLRTPSRTTAYDLPTRSAHDAIQLMLIERRPNEEYGELERLGGLTLLQMSTYTVSQLSEL